MYVCLHCILKKLLQNPKNPRLLPPFNIVNSRNRYLIVTLGPQGQILQPFLKSQWVEIVVISMHFVLKKMSKKSTNESAFPK